MFGYLKNFLNYKDKAIEFFNEAIKKLGDEIFVLLLLQNHSNNSNSTNGKQLKAKISIYNGIQDILQMNIKDNRDAGFFKGKWHMAKYVAAQVKDFFDWSKDEKIFASVKEKCEMSINLDSTSFIPYIHMGVAFVQNQKDNFRGLFNLLVHKIVIGNYRHDPNKIAMKVAF